MGAIISINLKVSGVFGLTYHSLWVVPWPPLPVLDTEMTSFFLRNKEMTSISIMDGAILLKF
jgi:hypothetical protein